MDKPIPEAVLSAIRHAADNGGATEGQCYGWWRELTAAQQQGQAVAEVGPGWTLAYCGSDPIAEICRRHPELRIGTKLYTAPQPMQQGGGEVTVEQKIELVRQGWTAPNAPPSAPVGVGAGWYRYNKPAPRWEDTKFGKWLDPAVYGPPREQHGYSLEVAALAQQPAAVDGALSEKAESWCAHCLSPPHMWGMICCHEYVASGGKTLRLTASEAKLEHERRNALAAQHQEPTT